MATRLTELRTVMYLRINSRVITPDHTGHRTRNDQRGRRLNESRRFDIRKLHERVNKTTVVAKESRIHLATQDHGNWR